jgi:hypothetical protein
MYNENSIITADIFRSLHQNNVRIYLFQIYRVKYTTVNYINTQETMKLEAIKPMNGSLQLVCVELCKRVSSWYLFEEKNLYEVIFVKNIHSRIKTWQRNFPTE